MLIEDIDDDSENTKDSKSELNNAKMNYDAIILSIPEIVSALHLKAIAAISDKTIKIANSAITSEGNKSKLNSAGLHIISTLNVKEGEMVLKDAAIAALKTYVQWFVGPDLAKKINDKVVLPLNGGTNESLKVKLSFFDFFLESINEATEADDEDDAEEGDDDESGDEADTDEGAEDEDGENGDEAADGDKATDGDGKDSEGLEKGEGGDGKESALGWYIAYNLKVEGMKETPLKDALKDFATSFFDNLTLTASGLFGGGDKVTGKDIRKAVHDLKHVDHEKLAENIKKDFARKYPNIEEFEVLSRDSLTLYKEIKSYNLSKDERSAILAAAYCLWIKVKEENRAKPFLNKKKIAELVRKGMGAFRILKKANVTEDSIIKIENFNDSHDSESIKNNAKRPTATEVQEEIDKFVKDIIEKDPKLKKDGKEPDTIPFDKGIVLYNKLFKKFKSIKTDKKASQEKENKQALDLFKKYIEDPYKKCEQDKSNMDFKKMFRAFLTEYYKFENSIGESASYFSILNKSDVANSILRLLFEDMNINEITPELMLEDETEEEGDEGDSSSENSSSEKKTVEIDPDYKDFTSKLKDASKSWITSKKYKSSVMPKEDAIRRLKLNFGNDISKIESDVHKSFAIIDFHPESQLPESIKHRYSNLLEDGDQATDKIFNLVKEAFDDFKKAAGIQDNQVGDIITLESAIGESIERKNSNFLFEDKNLISLLEDNITTGALKLGKTKMKNPKLHNTYEIKAGESSEVALFLSNIGIGSSGDYDKIKSKKYAAAIVVKLPKDDGLRKYNGSLGAIAFTDDAVKKIYQTSFKGNEDFEYLVLSGTSSTIKYYNSKTNADVKVFIAACDEISGDGGGEDKKKENKENAYALPFTLTKDEEPPPPPDDDDPDIKDNSGDGTLKNEGTDLYIFPIESSKDFDEPNEVGEN